VGCFCDCFCCCCRGDKPATEDDKHLFGEDNRSFESVLGKFLGIAFDPASLGKSKFAKHLGPTMKSVAEFQVQRENVWDIWGAAKNTLLYCRSSTAKVTANGYAVWCSRRQLALAVWLFRQLFEKYRDDFASRDEYPANMPLEIRVTGPDYAANGNTASPFLSACTPDGVPQEILDDHPVILWLDNLSFPGSCKSNEFYARLEKELVEMYEKEGMFVRPEWSKGWGYDEKLGAYRADKFINHARASLPRWNDAVDTFNKLDPNHLFSNSFWDTIMTKVDPKSGVALSASGGGGAATAGPQQGATPSAHAE
jgi:hypothetical protein